MQRKNIGEHWKLPSYGRNLVNVFTRVTWLLFSNSNWTSSLSSVMLLNQYHLDAKLYVDSLVGKQHLLMKAATNACIDSKFCCVRIAVRIRNRPLVLELDSAGKRRMRLRESVYSAQWNLRLLKQSCKWIHIPIFLLSRERKVKEEDCGSSVSDDICFSGFHMDQMSVGCQWF